MSELNRMVRLVDMPKYVGLQRTQIDKLIKAGEFPKAIRLSDTGRAKTWLECDILAWQNEIIAKARNADADADPDAARKHAAKARAAKTNAVASQ